VNLYARTEKWQGAGDFRNICHACSVVNGAKLKTNPVDQESIEKRILTFEGQAIAKIVLANIATTEFHGSNNNPCYMALYWLPYKGLHNLANKYKRKAQTTRKL
jgi:hypothetical protein